MALKQLTATDQLTDDQFQRHALAILKREFGAGGLARFFRLNRSNAGDYSLDRDAWQSKLTVDQIVEAL